MSSSRRSGQNAGDKFPDGGEGGWRRPKLVDNSLCGMIQIDQHLQRQLSRSGLLLPLLRSEILNDILNEISLEPQVCQRALHNWCESKGVKSEEALIKFCNSHAMSPDDARWQAELPHKIDSYSLERFGHRAEQRFLQRKTALDQVTYSLLRVRHGGLAQELYLRIAECEASFSELAAEYSEGPEKSTRGIVGPIPLDQSHPRLVELLRSGCPGQLFLPIQIETWWIVFRLEELKAATFDESTKAMMCREMFEAFLNDKLAQRIHDCQPTQAD